MCSFLVTDTYRDAVDGKRGGFLSACHEVIIVRPHWLAIDNAYLNDNAHRKPCVLEHCLGEVDHKQYLHKQVTYLCM